MVVADVPSRTVGNMGTVGSRIS
jgi:hypothetical protein